MVDARAPQRDARDLGRLLQVADQVVDPALGVAGAADGRLATVGDAELLQPDVFGQADGRGVDGGFFDTDGVVAKFLFGGSYMIDIGTGLRIAAEYHYSGFGVENVSEDASILADPFFQARFLRGDSQLLGRHALGVSLSYQLLDDIAASLGYIQSLVDGSGVITPTLSWNQSDNVTIVLNVTAPWGTWPRGGVPTSEYGSGPITIFLQARLYD